MSPRGELLARLEPPEEASDFDFADLTVVGRDEVVQAYSMGLSREPRADTLYYRRRAPDWIPERVGAHNWRMSHHADNSPFRALADGLILATEMPRGSPRRYDLLQADGTLVSLEPGRDAAGGPIIGADGAIVFVVDLTNYSQEPLTREGLLVVYEPDGTERYRLVIEGVSPAWNEGAALGRDGTLYLSGETNRTAPAGFTYGHSVVVAVQTDVPGGPVEGWTQARGDARGSRSMLGH